MDSVIDELIDKKQTCLDLLNQVIKNKNGIIANSDEMRLFDFISDEFNFINEDRLISFLKDEANFISQDINTLKNLKL